MFGNLRHHSVSQNPIADLYQTYSSNYIAIAVSFSLSDTIADPDDFCPDKIQIKLVAYKVSNELL
jgi:hypothetical protein